MRRTLHSLLAVLGVLAAAHPALADQHEQVTQDLEQFDQNPQQFLNRELPKRTVEGDPAEESLFSVDAVQSKEYVKQRDQYRKQLCTVTEDGTRVCLKDAEPGRAPYPAAEDPARLVDELRYETLEAMEQNDLRSAELKTSPWSDDYWPYYSGILGKRYADPSFPGRTTNWETYYNYFLEHPLMELYSSGDQSAINELAPAEKFDLLIGETDGLLTDQQWEAGQRYFNQNSHKPASERVETWMGICHGWAPAAYMLPRPSRAVTVPAYDGETEITFYPSDIKALASLLWAQVRTPVNFIGGRCNVKEPETDDVGRVRSQECFDTNPGAWHQAVVNQIGVSGRSFIIDATYDYQVWNQPVLSYDYTYFNPQTRRGVETLEQAKVDLANFSEDKFASYRGDRTESVVGIAMNVNYIVETSPSDNPVDKESFDGVKQVTYYYDLELDRNGKIIGGEWYTNRHPDFLWTPSPGAKAQTAADHQVSGTWNGEEPLPRSWRYAATRAARNGEPLGHIVRALFELAAEE